LSELQRLRRYQFLSRHAYQLQDPSRLRVLLYGTTDDDDTSILSDSLANKDRWHVLPSVAEQVQSLSRALPSSHPLEEELRELVLDLQQEVILIIDNDEDVSKQLKRLTKAHRLHASLLSRCTLNCRPIRCDPGFLTTRTTTPCSDDDPDPTTLTVTLEHYLGDILAAYYLLGHSISRIVQGGPTHRQWSQQITSQLQQQSTDANVWYQIWIYFQSTLLRSFPLTPDQCTALKVLPCGIRGRTVPQNVDYIHPHYPYIGTGTLVVEETTDVVQAFLQHTSVEDIPRLVHRTTLHHFGPLGAYRGRDRVRSITMDPGSVVHRLHHPSFCIPPTWFLLEQGRHEILDNPAFDAWFVGQDGVLQWMLELQEECGRSRPMTVQPPMVTIEPILLSVL
jgi:hypothetical protein